MPPVQAPVPGENDRTGRRKSLDAHTSPRRRWDRHTVLSFHNKRHRPPAPSPTWVASGRMTGDTQLTTTLLLRCDTL